MGAVSAAPVGRRWGNKLAFALGLLFTAAATGASGLTASLAALMALRAMAGFFSGAIVFVSGAGLVAAAAAGGPPSRAPTFLGVYFAGAGIDVTASALAVQPLMVTMGWQGGWLVLGALAPAATLVGWIALG